jgi:glutaminyl-peptide cyclotransferase
LEVRAEKEPAVQAPGQGFRAERWRVEVLAEIAHDPRAFTQGLLLYEGILYESTGTYGQSSIRRLNPATGDLLQRREVEADLFAEGLAMVGDRLVQITWHAGLARVLDPDTLVEVDRWSYRGQGWGLADDGQRLVMSDGSAILTLRDRSDFSPLESVEVLLDGQPLTNLNELEWAAGMLYANVWTRDEIVQIDMDQQPGTVRAVIDASELRRRLGAGARQRVDVLNGIAYDPQTETFLLTGKLWPKMFRVRFVGINS